MALRKIKSTSIADDAIDSDHYVDASIDNAHLADDAVGVAELSATGTASSSTYLRGDGAWASAGKVLQVVTWSDDTHVTYAAQTTTWTAMPDIAASITPTSTSSKILVNMSLGITAPTYTAHRLTRDGTDLFVGTAYSSNTVSSIGFSVYVENNAGGLNVSFFDSPSTTSAVEYSLKYLTPWSVGDIIYYNRGTDGNSYRNTGTSFITLMEIAG